MPPTTPSPPTNTYLHADVQNTSLSLTSSESLSRADVFARRNPLGYFTTFKLLLFGSFLIPLRVLLLVLFNVLWLPVLSISLSTNILTELTMYIWIRTQLFLLGFLWITTSGKKPKRPKDTSYLIIGNHTGWVEIAYITMTFLPSFVAKSPIKKWPIIGLITKSLNCIYVNRFNPNAGSKRMSTTDFILDNLKKENLKLAMFPEGTTTNGTHLVHFRSGAFVPGLPIVPLVFEMPFCCWDVSCSSYSIVWHTLGCMGQPVNFFRVRFLEVYYPSEVEKVNPEIFKKNVKKYMLDNSKLKESEYTYSDKLLYEKSVGYENSEVKKKRRREEKTRRRKEESAKRKIAPEEVEEEEEEEEEDESGHSIGHLSRSVVVVST
ncbi:hypothetical protein TrLO_g6839 [Triparma laevis f. longispina]|uniref:Phospholipid/glycerol acyltransferase domain-containing protein n=1 Tax=Triparma laevis f. longispina TaxID=1714387 RepID=A0A9W7KS22_9STRA|nr:hypothetical protein TrLO_g6839 [Triparma laevis f. longispina]